MKKARPRGSARRLLARTALFIRTNSVHSDRFLRFEARTELLRLFITALLAGHHDRATIRTPTHDGCPTSCRACCPLPSCTDGRSPAHHHRRGSRLSCARCPASGERGTYSLAGWPDAVEPPCSEAPSGPDAASPALASSRPLAVPWDAVMAPRVGRRSGLGPRGTRRLRSFGRAPVPWPNPSSLAWVSVLRPCGRTPGGKRAAFSSSQLPSPVASWLRGLAEPRAGFC